MRDIPAGLETHLDQTSTTLCHAWRLTRSDGLVMGFTEHDRALSLRRDRVFRRHRLSRLGGGDRARA
jgi:hypothetical protein